MRGFDGMGCVGWLEVSVMATPYGREILRSVLDDYGISQLEEFADTDEIHQVLRDSAESWDYVDEAVWQNRESGLRFYLPDTVEGQRRLDEIRCRLELMRTAMASDSGDEDLCGGCDDPGSWRLTVASREDEDWSRVWKEYFRGFPVGKRLFVKPCWEQACEEDLRGRVVLALALGGGCFGTGDHASTRFCLEWLESHVRPAVTVLDMGCGSGILSIAALLLGAAKAFAVDIDPQAVAEAGRNAGLNALPPERFRAVVGDGLAEFGAQGPDTEWAADGLEFLGGKGADLVVANMTADGVMDLAARLDVLMNPGGVFLASGIIEERWPEVECCLRERGFELFWRKQDQGWVAGQWARSGNLEWRKP
jgi:ribosomal protein L11 methyltransferase